jgi:hypothetical protein
MGAINVPNGPDLLRQVNTLGKMNNLCRTLELAKNAPFDMANF